MAVRFFPDMRALARGFAEAAVIYEIAMRVGVEATSVVLEKNVKAQYGSHDLAPLAQATIDERIALNFSPDDPLLRDGTLLRASIEREHTIDTAAVGSEEPIAGWSETGFVSARSGVSVPPRPAIKNGLLKSGKETVAIVGVVLDVTFNARIVP